MLGLQLTLIYGMFMSKVWPAVMELDVVDFAIEISSSIMLVEKNIFFKVLAEPCAIKQKSNYGNSFSLQCTVLAS